MDTFKNSGQYGNYGFSLDQGLQALNRTHAAAGNPASGNADADTLKYATGLANSTYGSYLSGLSPYLGANSSAIAGALPASIPASALRFELVLHEPGQRCEHHADHDRQQQRGG
jgi:hypothetical protein